MTTAVMQLIIIDGMVKVEFKITDNEGYSRFIEKEIKSIEEFEEFKEGVLAEIKTLEPVIKLVLKTKNNENTNGTSKAASKPASNIAGKIQSVGI